MSRKCQPLGAADYASLYQTFDAPVSRFDCGRKCAPLNGGEPVCCTARNAVPVVEKAEFAFLQTRTDMWRRFKPVDYPTRKIVEELNGACIAVECKGARFCERENRSIVCRGFPFFPYITRRRDFVGIGTYWVFEDRCWMMSHLELVDRVFVDQFVAAYETIFAKDPDEHATYVDFSATARRVYSRWKREIPLLGRDGGLLMVEPSTGAIRPGRKKDFPRTGPYVSERAYRAAVREAGGAMPAGGLRAG